MKKLLTLLVIGVFALAACEPMNITAAGNNTGPMEENISDSSMSTEESSSDDSSSDDSSTGDSEMSGTESSESSDPMEMELSSGAEDSLSMDSTSGYSVNVIIDNQLFNPAELTLHEGSVIQWTNNDDVSYTITIVKTSDLSDGSMDDSMDDSSSDSNQMIP